VLGNLIILSLYFFLPFRSLSLNYCYLSLLIVLFISLLSFDLALPFLPFLCLSLAFLFALLKL
jgi:hypothetical protein